MAGNVRKHRDSLKLTDDGEDDAKPVPRDRDQSAISPERAHEVADRAEYPDTPEAHDTNDPGEALAERDRMQDSPSPDEQRRAKPGSETPRGAPKKP